MADKTSLKLLSDFQSIWDECVNGSYKNQGKLLVLAKEIKKRDATEPFKSLSEKDALTLKYALFFTEIYSK